jgi:AcrR family transcriptional regulator
MLFMRSAGEVDDLTARARIRDAAVRRFAVDGFGVPVRALAVDAGVSPALVIHHFGSKDALIAACDEHVLATIRDAERTSVLGAAPADLLTQLATVERYAPAAGYVVQALLAGGELATAFLDSLVADAEQYLADAVQAGTIRPSRDPAARARYLVDLGIGVLLVHLRRHPPQEGDLATALRHYADTTTLPALELYTEGLLTDPGLLDTYLAARGELPPPAS